MAERLPRPRSWTRASVKYVRAVTYAPGLHFDSARPLERSCGRTHEFSGHGVASSSLWIGFAQASVRWLRVRARPAWRRRGPEAAVRSGPASEDSQDPSERPGTESRRGTRRYGTGSEVGDFGRNRHGVPPDETEPMSRLATIIQVNRSSAWRNQRSSHSTEASSSIMSLSASSLFGRRM